MHYEKYIYIYNDDPPQYVCYYVSVPRDLDKHTTITIDNETFDIEADDLEVISELGKTIFLSWFFWILAVFYWYRMVSYPTCLVVVVGISPTYRLCV
jgi:hypothetical protein